MNTPPAPSGTPGSPAPSGAPPADGITSLTLKPGDTVDDYTIVQQVGAGGSAIVFAAYDQVLNRTVAIKQVVVSPGEDGDELRQRVLAEAQHHKQVAAAEPSMLVQYIDLISDPRGLFLITEFVNGPSLEWILQSETKPMEQRQAMGIIAASAKGLAAIHNAQMLHRDLKPANILLPREGGLKIGDFGLAAMMNEQQAMDLGSVRYMAPELLQGEAGSLSSDLYSLGIVAYEMLAGRDLFNEAFRTILRDQRNQAMRWVKWHTNVRAKATPLSTLLPEIPQPLSDLIARMMEKEPSRRVDTTQALLEGIRLYFAGQAQGMAPAPPPHQVMHPRPVGDVSETAAVPKRSKIPLALAALLLCGLIGTGGFVAYTHQQKQKLTQEQIQDFARQVQQADTAHTQEDYEQARASFMHLRNELLDAHSQSRGKAKADYLLLGQLATAGLSRSEGVQHVATNDFISATAAFEAYLASMQDIQGDTHHLMETTLSLDEATRLAESHRRRADFQQIAQDIGRLLDTGNLSDAGNMIRRQSDIQDLAEDDRATLAALDARYRQLRTDKHSAEIDARAQTLAIAGDIDGAIALLNREVRGNPEAPATELAERLAALHLGVQRAASDLKIVQAENENDVNALIQALAERLSFDPESTVHLTRYNTLINNRDTDQAEQFINVGRINQAEALLAEVLRRDPDHSTANQLMAEASTLRAYLEKKREAEQAFSSRGFEQAITLANEAIGLGGDTDPRMNEIITRSTGQIALAAALAGIESSDLDTAGRQLAIARNNLGNTSEILALEARVNELHDYQILIAKGDAHFQRGEYGAAKRAYLEAGEIFYNEQINEQIRDCEFYTWLDICDRDIQDEEWENAKSALSRAEAIHINDDTRERREKIGDHTQ